jgi:hypothetical protein
VTPLCVAHGRILWPQASVRRHTFPLLSLLSHFHLCTLHINFLTKIQARWHLDKDHRLPQQIPRSFKDHRELKKSIMPQSLPAKILTAVHPTSSITSVPSPSASLPRALERPTDQLLKALVIMTKMTSSVHT